ncbi:MAG TPA: hypothetical protein K8V56_10445 [Sporosarcina psychrophila]|jgi:hypothetical protein|uniref:Uncharacterized protein n=1 Tax=Sporosarcina psychrophila TaxID=1476 RepID=A0A921FYP3_SPOPS|nr:hypothetical protein [Sporosarcina psychrophila]
MKYSRTKMEQLVKNDKELAKRLKQIMAELDLEKSFALKALYHADVKDGGTHQRNYQEL